MVHITLSAAAIALFILFFYLAFLGEVVCYIGLTPLWEMGSGEKAVTT